MDPLNTTTETTPGARRAAERINETFDLLPLSQHVQIPRIREIVAEIIDRETGTPELLEALKAVLEEISDTGSLSMLSGRKAQAAIARAEGRAGQ